MYLRPPTQLTPAIVQFYVTFTLDLVPENNAFPTFILGPLHFAVFYLDFFIALTLFFCAVIFLFSQPQEF